MIWVIVGTIAPMVIGLLLAMLLWRRPQGFTLFRTVFFMPQVLSSVVIGIVWGWIYNPIFGILNKLLDAVGLEESLAGWLGDPDVALYAVLVAAIWAEIGFVFVVFLAGLQNVSQDLLEAATLDGANAWQRFWNVTVPQMANVITVVSALLLIGGFNVFDIIFVMTGGGPANATEVIATYTYKEAFTQNRVGYASTLSLVMTVISLVASVPSSACANDGGLTMAITAATRETFAGPGSPRAVQPGASRRWRRHLRHPDRLLVIFLLPFIWIWSSAFKTSLEIARDPFALPTELRWENLVEAWTVGHFADTCCNSVIYCVAIVAGGVALSCLAGYGLAMLPLPAGNVS